jgi:hypothetical protein
MYSSLPSNPRIVKPSKEIFFNSLSGLLYYTGRRFKPSLMS